MVPSLLRPPRRGLGRPRSAAASAALVAAQVVLPLVLLVVLVDGGWAPLRRLDLGTARALHEVALRHDRLVDALDVVAVVFHPRSFQILVGVAVVVLLYGRRHRLAAWAAGTMYGGALLSPLVKGLLDRPRPTLAPAVAAADGYSLPSGHALNSLLGCAVLLVIVLPHVEHRWQRRAALLAAGVVVLLTGFDRVALGVHYVSDVLAGWLIALAVLAATSAGQDSPARSRATHAAASRKSRSDVPRRTDRSSTTRSARG